ncbi:DNA primase [Imhoffiella purpurea]|uniref:DNA primase n=1 Tax=Imhoffiella purpurea TaxID=1249627 RepID=W9VVJ0_9GAMM|nr:DNA primase [Imhoffiella purpurea]EXJ14425.1 DNA primase [Imhoffiella purpurea]
MSGRIPPEFIDDLIARTDIVDLIGSRLQLRKAGKDYQARCPFHDEKTPSFTVSPDKQFYHCFGCGAHGTAIGFLMEYDRLPFREAVEELAQRAGLTIPASGQAQPSGPDNGPLYGLLEQVSEIFRQQLRDPARSEPAVAYLKSRGLSGEIAATFGIGYAPPGYNFLLSRLGATAERREQLMTVGLLAEQDGRRYDRFRDRIMFPIRDRRGRVIGFGGRLLGDGKPKYLNSPETPVFHKGRELYGLFEAQQADRKLGALLIVEGYLDVIALAQFGITNAVATLGTATTAEHLQQLLRTVPDLVFCFDGDRAGRSAAWKALETALPLVTGHQSIRFLFLPEGDDPDTLVRREGAEGMTRLIEGAAPLSEFLFDHLSEQVDMTSLDGRARLGGLAKPLLERMPAGLYRDLIANRLSNLAGLSQPSKPGSWAGRRRGRSDPMRPMRLSLVAQSIALLLDHPDLAARVLAMTDDRWRRSESPGAEVLVELLEMLAAAPDLNKAALLERWREHPHFAYLQRLSVAPFLRDIAEEDVGADLVGALTRLGDEADRAERSRHFNQRSTADWSPEERARLERALQNVRVRREE